MLNDQHFIRYISYAIDIDLCLEHIYNYIIKKKLTIIMFVHYIH